MPSGRGEAERGDEWVMEGKWYNLPKGAIKCVGPKLGNVFWEGKYVFENLGYNGESEAGKSTLIGHLTGQFGKSDNGLKHNGTDFGNVPLSGGGLLNLFSMRCALQENSRGKERPVGALTYIRKKFEKRVSTAFKLLTCFAS